MPSHDQNDDLRHLLLIILQSDSSVRPDDIGSFLRKPFRDGFDDRKSCDLFGKPKADLMNES